MPDPDLGGPPPPALAGIGWDDARRAEIAALGTGLRPARCIRVDGASALALTADGLERVRARVPIATGDWLAVGERWARRMERRTEIARRAPGGRAGARQVIAANVDLLIAVCGLDRPLRIGRVQRSIALARGGGARAHVLLTKADLVADPDAIAAGLSASVGVDVGVVSAIDGSGLAALAALAAPDRTVALVGESGAGKSTLTNALVDARRAVGEVRGGDAKGRHTTTARELVPLPGGGALIDTPGLREVGVADVAGVEAAFGEITAIARACRFGDCRHEGEPGCAVCAAAEVGLLDREDVARMAAMRREAQAAELRADEHERRRHERRFARVAREAQRHKRGRDR